MMDQKTWLWRKRSSEKTIAAIGEEVQSAPNQKELDLENTLEALNEKLASVLDECLSKQELVEKYQKMAEDAIAEKNKADEEIGRLRHEFDELQQQRTAENKRLGDLNSALKDCMDQLSLARKDQEQRVRDAVMQASKDFEKSHKNLTEKIANLTAESSYLSKALVVKEKIIDDLNKIKNQTEAEFEVLMTRLDSIEKENAFLRYEFRALEKELDLRNEEVEFSRRSLEASDKKHSENLKKIKKLEGECQRLRALTRKRLPIEEHVRHQIINNTRRETVDRGSVIRDSSAVYLPENTRKQMNLLIDQVHDLEKENRILKECLAKKEEEVFYNRKAMSLFSSGNSNEITSSRSWDTALVSETEHDKFSEPKTEQESKTIGASDMSLMDDFIEMEKLAIVAIDSPIDDSLAASDTKKPVDWLQTTINAILEQSNFSKKNIDELLGEIKTELDSIIIHHEPAKLLPISGYITWKSPASSPSSKSTPEWGSHSDLKKSINEIIEIVGGFDSSHAEDHHNIIYVFRCKSSELKNVMQELMHSCKSLSEGKIDIEKFSGDSIFVIRWIIEKCIISHRDHPTVVREEFEKHLGGAGPGTALGLESVQSLMIEMEKMCSNFRVEIEGLKKELSIVKSSSNEIEILRGLQRTSEDHQMENMRVMNEDLDAELTLTKAKLNEVVQKLSCVEVELDDKSRCCEELEGTCLELQLQLESITSNQRSEDNENQEELLQTGLEITKASFKLAECEETILKLGNQLKSLGSEKELSVVDKVLSITDAKFNQRSSLRDQMLCEDTAEADNLLSPKTKEIIGTNLQSANHIAGTRKEYIGTKNEGINAKDGALVIVPSRKKGRGLGFWRKVLLRRKKANSKNNTSW